MILFVLGIRVALENPTFWCDLSDTFGLVTNFNLPSSYWQKY